MKKKVIGVQGPIPFRTPGSSPMVRWLIRNFSSFYLKRFEGIDTINTRGMDRLIRTYSGFCDGRHRLIIAFTHPSKSDPPVLASVFSTELTEAAKQVGVPLRRGGHIHFLYGIGVPVWAGFGAGWLLPRMGAIPVTNSKMDSRSVKLMRKYASKGRWPIAMAPEGQVTYHNKELGEIESGTAILGFWCRDDLKKEGKDQDVLILPVSIEYRYRVEDGHSLEDLLDQIDKELGIETHLYPAGERLDKITGHLLARLEEYYGNFRNPRFIPKPEQDFDTRFQHITDAALRVGETFYGLLGRGTFLQRVFRLRVAGWNYMFRADIENPDKLPAFEKAMADRLAREAHMNAHHMELADLLEYVHHSYIKNPTPERLFEYALNMLDIINRVRGGTIGQRPTPQGVTADVSIGLPLKVSEYEETYKKNRKTGIKTLTNALEQRLRELKNAE